ncbi:hypothetical protein BHE74_00059657 [Ensete ventricosum]|nr:hypothetical protein GW17_00057968 [Ensete ventricosum]RWW35415.1 hypothetical protein BHE74_00059657 [Ensete ventricosum]RZS29241.1 hypothetical protein BHM03_00062952 [Ensete ventricosum]
MRSLRGLLLLLLVNVAAWGTEAVISPIGDRKLCVGEAQWPCYRLPRLAPGPVVHDPLLETCLIPLRPVDGCIRSIFRWRSTGEVNLSPECCRAVKSMENPCFTGVFQSPYVDESFAPTVKRLCALTNE